MRGFLRSLAITLWGAVALVLLLPASVHALSWEIGTASWRRGVYTSLALDSQANAHISYYDTVSRVLVYSWFDGQTFQTEVVDRAYHAGVGDALALDSQDRPHISYVYSPSDPINILRYAHFDGTTWQIETVDPQGGGGTSIALDSQDRPHISYCDCSNGVLKHAHFDGASWQVETVDLRPRELFATSLKLDTEGHPHIAYSGWEQLRYAVFDGTAWQVETVEDGLPTDIVGVVSLVLDSAGHPRIAYDHMRLKYARWDGTAWRIEVPVPEGGWNPTLGLDRAEHPLIAYQDFDPIMVVFFLKLARFDGLEWQTVIVDRGGVGLASSLKVDPQDRVHISYYDDRGGRVKYARGTPEVALDLQLNQATFYTGQSLTFGVTVTPGPVPPTADAYVALALPDGTLLFLQGDGTFTRVVRPIVRNWPVSAVSGALFQYAFSGAESEGTYTWFAAFTRPGTLSLIEPLTALPFSFCPAICVQEADKTLFNGSPGNGNHVSEK